MVAIEDGSVCFRDQGSQSHRWNTMTLPAQECMRRVLPHVVPQGFHKVRDSGLWSPLHRPLLHPRQLWLARPAPDPPPASPGPASQPTDAGCPPLRAASRVLTAARACWS
jgi:hypothetical protein